jgi:hypothetical protein
MTKQLQSTVNGADRPVGGQSIATIAKLARNLSRAIDDPQTTERDLKAFFDTYPGALPTPWLLNHGVHSGFIFPEYQLGARFQCDYMYLTKSSGEWWCVLLEIESPHARLFRGSGKDIKVHSDLNNALDQVRDWREHLSKEKEAFLRGLAPVLFPHKMAGNPLSFKYALVIGRSAEFKDDRRKAERLATLNANVDTRIMTYDSALSDFRFQHRRGQYAERSLVVAYGARFRFRSFVPDDWAPFWWHMTPANLYLTPAQVKLAENAGIRVKEWLAGREMGSRPSELSKLFPDTGPSS